MRLLVKHNGSYEFKSMITVYEKNGIKKDDKRYFLRDIYEKTEMQKHLGSSKGMPGSDLLSHKRTLHYHRRYCISLLCSEWEQVVLQHYGRQANWV